MGSIVPQASLKFSEYVMKQVAGCFHIEVKQINSAEKLSLYALF